MDKFWETFGKFVALVCFIFTVACAVGLLIVLNESYRTILKQEPITVLPMDSSHVHKGVK